MTNFSVLMSLYYKERPEYLRESLDSVFNQTITPTEVVIVEDGPLTAGLYAILDEFKQLHDNIKIVKLATNSGLGIALAKGLEKCKSELVARMDTDDISKRDRFEKQVKFMDMHEDIDICSSWIDEFEDTPTNIISVKRVPESHEDIIKFMRRRSPINHPSVIFKKKAVIKAGNYQYFHLFEDWYLWARMYALGSKFANIQESLLLFRTSKDMYKRRGGWKYAINGAKFQWTLHRLGVISVAQAVINAIERGIVCIAPNKLRQLLYTVFLREK